MTITFVNEYRFGHLTVVGCVVHYVTYEHA